MSNQTEKDQEIQRLHKLLAKYRTNLARLEERLAEFGGPMHSTIELENSIDESKQAIGKIKNALRHKYGVKVDNRFGEDNHDDNTAFKQSSHRSQLDDFFPTMDSIRKRLQPTIHEFEILHRYKTLHDNFQDLEFAYNGYPVLYNNGKIARKRIRWKSLKANAENLIYYIDIVVGFTEKYFNSTNIVLENLTWLGQLKLVSQHLDSTISDADYDQLEILMGHIRNAVGRIPSRINNLLVNTVVLLEIPDVVRLMRTFCTELKQGQKHLDLRSQIDPLLQDSIELVKDLAQLYALAKLHDTFQELDKDIREIELHFGRSITQITGRWASQQERLSSLCRCGEEWAPKLHELSDQVGSAIDKKQLLSIRLVFADYRSHVFLSFRRLDGKLLSTCDDLRTSNGPLQRVQRALMYEQY